MQLRHLEVGQLFEPGRTHYDEGVKFEFTQSGPMLLMFFDRPTTKEIESIRVGKFKIGFYDIDNIIFILAKFEGMKWIDAPYSVHLSQPFEFAKELEEQESLGFGLQIFLIDAATGILEVMRYVGLGHEFSVKLLDTILKQKEAPFDTGVYSFKLNEIYKRYSTDQLADYARWFYKTENQR
jgi:hypothetical protein